MVNLILLTSYYNAEQDYTDGTVYSEHKKQLQPTYIFFFTPYSSRIAIITEAITSLRVFKRLFQYVRPCKLSLLITDGDTVRHNFRPLCQFYLISCLRGFNVIMYEKKIMIACRSLGW